MFFVIERKIKAMENGKHLVQHRGVKNALAFFWKDSYCRTQNVKP